MLNVKAGEKIAVLGYVPPQTVSNTEKFTETINMGNHEQVLGVATLGDMANENIAFTCYATHANGTVIGTAKAAANLAASATVNDNKIVAISIRRDELLANGAQYCKFGLVTGSNVGGPAAVVAYGVDSDFQPATDYNLANVAEVKL